MKAWEAEDPNFKSSIALCHTAIFSGSPPLRSRKNFEYGLKRTAISLLVCTPTIENFSRAVFEKNEISRSNFNLSLEKTQIDWSWISVDHRLPSWKFWNKIAISNCNRIASWKVEPGFTKVGCVFRVWSKVDGPKGWKWTVLKMDGCAKLRSFEPKWTVMGQSSRSYSFKVDGPKMSSWTSFLFRPSAFIPHDGPVFFLQTV